MLDERPSFRIECLGLLSSPQPTPHPQPTPSGEQQADNIQQHAEAGHYYGQGAPVGELPGDADLAASLAVGEGQNGMGVPLVNTDGSLAYSGQDMIEISDGDDEYYDAVSGVSGASGASHDSWSSRMPGSMMGELFGSTGGVGLGGGGGSDRSGAEGNISEGAEGTPVRATHPLTVEHVQAHSSAYPMLGGSPNFVGSIAVPSTQSNDDW